MQSEDARYNLCWPDFEIGHSLKLELIENMRDWETVSTNPEAASTNCWPDKLIPNPTKDW